MGHLCWGISEVWQEEGESLIETLAYLGKTVLKTLHCVDASFTFWFTIINLFSVLKNF